MFLLDAVPQEPIAQHMQFLFSHAPYHVCPLEPVDCRLPVKDAMTAVCMSEILHMQLYPIFLGLHASYITVRSGSLPAEYAGVSTSVGLY